MSAPRAPSRGRLRRCIPAAPLDDARKRLWDGCGRVLLAARAARPQPARDDKVVAGWNGLAVAALAEAGAVLDRPELVAAAERIAGLP